MESFWIADAFVYDHKTAVIMEAKDCEPREVVNDGRSLCFCRICADGMLPITLSPNAPILTKEGFKKAVEVTVADEVVMNSPETIQHIFSTPDETFWVEGEKLAQTRHGFHPAFLSASNSSLATFINGFSSNAKEKGWQGFETELDAFFFHLATSKARGTVAAINSISRQVFIPPIQRPTEKTFVPVFSVETVDNEAAPFRAFRFDGETRLYANSYTVGGGTR